MMSLIISMDFECIITDKLKFSTQPTTTEDNAILHHPTNQDTQHGHHQSPITCHIILTVPLISPS